MDLNLKSTREVDPTQPRVVVYQFDAARPMNPRGLLVAYEENGSVLPVASDFDAFLIGTRGVSYPPLPPVQLPFIFSLIRHLEAILAKPSDHSWAHRWLTVLKGNTPAEAANAVAAQMTAQAATAMGPSAEPDGALPAAAAAGGGPARRRSFMESMRRLSLTNLAAVQEVTSFGRWATIPGAPAKPAEAGRPQAAPDPPPPPPPPPPLPPEGLMHPGLAALAHGRDAGSASAAPTGGEPTGGRPRRRASLISGSMYSTRARGPLGGRSNSEAAGVEEGWGGESG